MRASRRMAVYNSGEKFLVLFDGTVSPKIDKLGPGTDSGNDSNWQGIDGGASGTVIFGTSEFYFENTGYASSTSHRICKTPIDVTNYKTMKIDIKPLRGGGNGRVTVSLNDSLTTYRRVVEYNIDTESGAAYRTVSLDVSNLSGTHYFMVEFWIWGAYSSGQATIRKVWLE